MKKTLVIIILLLCSAGSGFALVNNLIHRGGCCSHHGGVCGCSSGRALCCDGTLSPSCGCD